MFLSMQNLHLFISMQNLHLFTVTSCVFIVINTIENIIHFTIGRNVQSKNEMKPLTFEMPTKYDIIKIVIVMIIFALLQGIMTCYFQGCFSFHL